MERSRRVTLAVLVAALVGASCHHDSKVAPVPEATVGEPSSTLLATHNSAPSTQPERTLLNQWCSHPMPRVQTLANASGHIGGYAVSETIPDAPITFFDAAGNTVGSFHIFSEPQTTETTPGAVERLRTSYPNFTVVDCGAFKTP
jgi:hypothetical protein